jgi:hypothetical protein
MKPIVINFLIVAAVAASIALGLHFSGLRLSSGHALAAGLIAAVASTLALVPVQRYTGTDAMVIVQLALVGTVLHLIVAALLAVAGASLHLVSFHGAFIFWLLGAYWFSLVVLVWQLRKIIIRRTQGPHGPATNAAANTAAVDLPLNLSGMSRGAD